MTTLNPPVQSSSSPAFLRFLRTLSLILVIFIGLPLGALYFVFGVVVPPNAIGVRVNYFRFGGLLHQGYSDDGLSPGLHLRVPGVSEIITLPRTFLTVSYLSEGAEGGADFNLGPLQVQSRNGPWINTDASVVLRLFRSEHSAPPAAENQAPRETQTQNGGPADLITFFGVDQSQMLSKFSRIAQNELSKSLNELTSSDFYNPELREAAADKALGKLRDLVAPRGVEVWRTLIRRYQYQKEEIDNQIFAKNVQTQTARLRAAQTSMAEVTAEIQRITESWNQKIREKEVEGQNYALRKAADARFLEETKVAEGEKLLRTQTAEITAQKNRLLTDLAGADVYIARDMVPLLRSIRGGIIRNLDPYDIDAWLQRFTGKAQAGTEHLETKSEPTSLATQGSGGMK